MGDVTADAVVPAIGTHVLAGLTDAIIGGLQPYVTVSTNTNRHRPIIPTLPPTAYLMHAVLSFLFVG